MVKGFQIWVVLLIISNSVYAQGPFAPAADSVGSTAIHADSNVIYGWVNNCTVTRGYQDITNTSGPLADVGQASNASGKADGGVVSLGDGGFAIITLDTPISDHEGYDFAVFENGLFDFVNKGYFLELAFVEVSSNGVDFYRFPNQSLTDYDVQVGSFQYVDPTQITGLAGKYTTTYGCPFDLAEMDTVTGLNTMSITHIKVIDVVGNIDTNYASFDSYGRTVNDPWPTVFGSGGFDLDAIALIDSSLVLGINGHTNTALKMYPNPVSELLFIEGIPQAGEVKIFIFNAQGSQINVPVNTDYSIPVGSLPKGVYFVVVQLGDTKSSQKFIKF